MLQCPSHDERSCSEFSFCRWDSGVCRTSEGMETFFAASHIANELVDTCGWFGSLLVGLACRGLNASQCSTAGCATGSEHWGLIRDGSQCAVGVCGESEKSFVDRACAGTPGYDYGKAVSCYYLEDMQEFFNCTQAVCPEYSSYFEIILEQNLHWSEEARCSNITSEVECKADPSCYRDPTHSLCRHHSPSYTFYVLQTCKLATWADLDTQCDQAKTEEACATYNKTCTWKVQEKCHEEGPLVNSTMCVPRPEIMGLYLRPDGMAISPAMDLISKAIISAHSCAAWEKSQCRLAQGQDSGSVGKWDVTWTWLLVLGTVVVAFVPCLCALVVWRRRRNRLEQQKAQEMHSVQVLAGDNEVSNTEVSTNADSSFLFSKLGLANAPAILSKGIAEHWFLPPADLSITSVVGKGGFGEVSRGTLFASTEVAIKFAYRGADHVLADPALLNEIRLLRRVRHPNIVLFHGVSVLERAGGLSMCIVLEWVAGGNLGDFIKKLSSSSTAQAWATSAVKLVQDTARGLAYLHAQDPPIMHRDLKPANILIESHEPPLAKLADFGLSLLEDGRSKSRAGSKRWMAPEVREGNKHYGLPADIYSFGCVIGFVNDARPESVDDAWPMSSKLTKLFENCTLEDPSSRPLISDIYTQLVDEESTTLQEESDLTKTPSSDRVLGSKTPPTTKTSL
eukprot:TRINITY_DN10027_c0_g2_i1.p1 TRINITY_DN10027_c0_g2~~TRINITY_DN10027_c0_g2_i1.p1  ORF type:complete len:792 (+),score=117.59 TRINITY_DN10027_c0_g2_i1:337-2376(+)